MNPLISISLVFILFASCTSRKNATSTNIILSSSLTSSGLGDIKVGDSFSGTLSRLPIYRSYVTGSEGLYWDAIVVDLGKGEWVIIENDDANFSGETIFIKDVKKSNSHYKSYDKNTENNKVKVIKTNSTRIRTPNGVKVGMSIKELESNGQSLELISDYGGLCFRLSKEKVFFRIADNWEKSYQDNGGEFPASLDGNATIKELIVH